MKKSLLLYFCLLAFKFTSQNVTFEKSNFPGKKEEFKDAMKKLTKGMELFDAGRKEFEDTRRNYVTDHQRAGLKNFKSALVLLTDVQKFNPDNSALNYVLGFMSFMMDGPVKETIAYLEKAKSLDQEVATDLLFWLAWSHHLNSNWAEAISLYQKYRNFLQAQGKVNILAMQDVTKKMEECRVGQRLSEKPERVFIDNLGPTINSPFAEYSPAISADEETIFFTSRKQNSTG
jgi:tetratricopeptide (TPR) repeat protein